MNGNTQFGTATPNGNVNTDGWMDSTASDTLFSSGALKGFAVAPTSTTGLSLNVGGAAYGQDVAIAKNVAGDTARIAGHASTPYVLTLPGAPGTSGQSKVFSIVAYIDTTITAMTQNGVDTVGVTYVAGTAAATGSQVPPTIAQIRSAIPNGQTAFISVVANVTLAYGATAIVAGNIVANKSTMPWQNVSLATFKNYSTLLPRATINNIALGYGMTGTLNRYGDMVFLKFNDGGSYNINSGITSLGETIPSGYRPMDAVPINLSRGPGGTGQTVVYTINSNGSMSVYTTITISGEFLRGGYGFWLTSDTWPS